MNPEVRGGAMGPGEPWILGDPAGEFQGGVPLGAMGTMPMGGWPKGPWPPPLSGGGRDALERHRGGVVYPPCSLGVSSPDGPPISGLDYVDSGGPRESSISGKNR